jgi:hypothetical protein
VQDVGPGSFSGLQSGVCQAEAKIHSVIFGVQDFPDFGVISGGEGGNGLQLLMNGMHSK